MSVSGKRILITGVVTRRSIAFARVMTDVPFEDVVLRALRDGVMTR